jgi:pullulanase/glycogen debranching enzyme
MSEADWRDPQGRTLGVLLATGDPARGCLYALLNASDDWVEYQLPDSAGRPWRIVADTADVAPEGLVPDGGPRWVRPKSALVFRRAGGAGA